MERSFRSEPLKIGENPNKWMFKRHEYDIDIIEVYKKLEILLTSSSNLSPHIDKKEYLKNFKYGIECYCKARKIDFNFHFNAGDLIIPSTEEYYVNCLGMALICWDFYKIRAFLNYQKEKYQGKDLFVKIVEFGAYSIMTRNTPFEGIEERQALLMNWIAGQRNRVEKKSSIRAVTNHKIQKRKPAEIKKIENLFRDESQVKSIISILQKQDIINTDGTWIGLTNKNSEVLALIDVLREKCYIKKYPQTLTAKLFCEKFKLELSDRSLRTKTQVYYDHLDEYKRIIPDLKP